MIDYGRLSGMIGLAMRGGKLVVGTEQVCIALAKQKLKLVLVSSHASDGTKKKIYFKCEFYKTHMAEVDIDTDELGRLVGKTYSPAAVGIADDNFARAMTDILESDGK